MSDDALKRAAEGPRSSSRSCHFGTFELKYITSDLLKAAAEVPLIEDANKQAAFDPESFRLRFYEADRR